MCHLCLSFPVRLCEIFYNNISQECLCWNFMRKSCGIKHDSAGCCEATGSTVCPFVSADYKMWTLCKVFHNSLLVTEVFWLLTLTPMSGCCYCSCLLRTALCLPGTFSLVQRCGQLAGSVCVYVCAPWRLLLLVHAPVRVLFHWSARNVLLRMCVQCI